ncbi:MAG: proton-conducting transporter membrane subunit [Gammaproteobacteria bacterium]|nr:proton-conducting transporter membrane subunit [Gammaproteobacteria bacterium]
MNPVVIMLTALLLPLAAALLIIRLRHRPNLRDLVPSLSALPVFAAVLVLAGSVADGERPAFGWAGPVPGFDLLFRLEPLGMLFALLASGLWVINGVYSVGYMRGNDEHHQTRFHAWLACSFSATLGIAFSGNLLTLFLFYEMLTLSTYALVAHHGDDASRASARVYLGTLLATSIGLLLPAIIWVHMVAGTTEFHALGALGDQLSGWQLALLLGLFLFGIGKAAVMPVHRWLPAAMVAPTPVSAVLHAVAVVKAGVFTLVKVMVAVFGTHTLAGVAEARWVLWVACFTVLAASLVALRQTSIKRLLAYSTISQLSYVVLAVALFHPVGSLAAVLHILAHGFGKITLFFAAGALATAHGIKYVGQLDGIGRRMPVTMAAFSLGALSMIGLPPAAGFVSKWYMLLAAQDSGQTVAVVTLVLSTLLNAGYFLPLLHRAWFRPSAEGETGFAEAPVTMVVPLALTALAILAFFLFHAPALELAQMIPGVGT